jgi:hypothetical protein
METVSHIYREIHGSLIPINLDGLLGGVEHDSAAVAVLEVSFQLPTQVLVEFAVDIEVQFLQHLLAVHGLPFSKGSESAQRFMSGLPADLSCANEVRVLRSKRALPSF